MAEASEPVNEQTTPETKETPAAEPEEKTYSGDYVRALREEAKGYRTTKKTYESALKGLLNTDNLDDLDNKIKAYNDAHNKAIEDANNRTNNYIIESELTKAIGDTLNDKLTRKLLDRSAIKVVDGKVEGLTEAIQKLEEEYPEIRKQKAPKLADGTGTSKTDNKDDEQVAKFRKALGLK